MSLHGKVFRAAMEDGHFVADLRAAFPKDEIPNKYFADELKKSAYGSAYMGWLIGRCGPLEGKRLYEEIKAK